MYSKIDVKKTLYLFWAKSETMKKQHILKFKTKQQKNPP